MKHTYSKYIFSLVLFGSNGILSSFIQMESQQIVLWRTFIGTVTLSLLYFMTSRKRPMMGIKENKEDSSGDWRKTGKDLSYVFLSGLTLGGSWLFLYEAYGRIGVSMATLVYYLGPVLVMIVSCIVFKEGMGLEKILSFLVVIAGMLLVNGSSLRAGGISLGLIYGLGAAVMYMLMVICNKKAINIQGPKRSMYQLVAAFILTFLYLTFRHDGLEFPPLGSLLPLLTLGIINTGLGCFLYFSAMQYLPVQTVSICGYIEPGSAVILSMLFLNEQMTLVQLIGAIFVLVGAIVAEQVHPKGNRMQGLRAR